MKQVVTKHITLAWWVDRAIKDLISSKMAVTAGLGSGKSHGAIQWIYERLRANPKCERFSYMMPIYELIHNTAIPKTRKVLDDIGLVEGRHFEIIKSPYPRCIFKTTKAGQSIDYLSGNRPDKIKSVEYGCGVVDEPGVTEKESKKRLRERLRDLNCTVNQLMEIGTPEGINDYAEEYDSDKNEGWDRSSPRDHILKRLTEDNKIIQLRRFRVTTYDNQEFLPPGYITELLDTHRGNQAYIDSYIYGLFVPLISGGAYSNYKPRLHDIADIDPDPMRDIILTWDFNYNPLAWVSLQQRWVDDFDERKMQYVGIHESNQGSSTLDEAVAEFSAKHPVGLFANTPIKLYGDRTGHAGSHKVDASDFEAILRYLRSVGYRAVEIEATHLVAPEGASVDAVQRLFLLDMLRVCRRCHMLRRSFSATRWQDGVRKLEKPSGETHTHHSDSVKYWAWQETSELTNTEQRRRVYGINR